MKKWNDDKLNSTVEFLRSLLNSGCHAVWRDQKMLLKQLNIAGEC